MATGFGDLLQRAEQLTADMDTGSELPRIERNLQQLADAGQRLWSKTASSAGDNADVKASLLLSTKGVELPRLSSRLEALNTTRTFEPLEPVADTDIQSFLKNERENAILSAIEHCKRSTFAQAEKNFWQSMEDEWEKSKQKILTSLLSAGKEAMVFPIERETLEDYAIGQGRSPMTNIEMAYARQVYVCNEHSLQGRHVNMVEALVQIAAKSDDKNVKDTWDLLQQMITDLPPLSANVVKSRNSQEMQIAMVRNAKNLLEERYLKYVEDTVYRNLQQAKLGGIPGTLNKVKSFLKIKLPPATPGLEDGVYSGIPVWALIYYCLRCGDSTATSEAAEALPPQFSEFKEFLKEFLTSEDQRLQPSSEAKIRLQYRRSIRTSTDPFKRIVYCLIGCCDSSDSHSDVASKTDDYIWMKLHQIGFDEHEEGSQERISLAQLQMLLLEDYGPSHFKAYQQPFLYCQVLFLTAQFEAGIEFLSSIERCRCHAAHFAIVLKEANLLSMPHDIHAQLLSIDQSDPKPMRRVNFARLIMTYTRKFEITDPREALEYFYLLRRMKGLNNEDLLSACVSELVLETREFETLLGRLNSDGSRKPGYIEKFKLDTTSIIAQVAKDAESKGQFEDAATLYDLAENHEKVLEVLSRLMCQMVSLSSSPQSSRERLQTIARSIAERYKSRGHKGTRTRSSTFYLLLDLMYFFDLYHARQHDVAMDVIRKIKLLPFAGETVDQKVTAFRQYTDEVRQCLPDVLLATMTILYEKYRKTRSDSQSGRSPLKKGTDSDKDGYLSSLRQQARAIVTFAGLLPYRMPGDTNARLVQLEVMMN